MLEATIELTGVTDEEIIMALDEAKRQIEAGNRSGWETREDDLGSYSFEISGEENEYIECENCNQVNDIIDDKIPDTCLDCGEELNNS